MKRKFFSVLALLALLLSFAVPVLADGTGDSDPTITQDGKYKYYHYDAIVDYMEVSSVFGYTTVQTNNFTESLAEGDWIEIYAEYNTGVDMSSFDPRLLADAYCEVQVQLSIVGSGEYEIALDFGNQNETFSGVVYDSNDLVTTTIATTLEDVLFLGLEANLSYYSYSSNFYVEFRPVEYVIRVKQDEIYDPKPITPPGGEIGDDYVDAEDNLLDQVGDGESATEDVTISAIQQITFLLTAFQVVSGLLQPFLLLPFVDTLLTVSLALGSSALLLGIVVSVSRRH